MKHLLERYDISIDQSELYNMCSETVCTNGTGILSGILDLLRPDWTMAGGK